MKQFIKWGFSFLLIGLLAYKANVFVIILMLLITTGMFLYHPA
jgi:hypothetical protein